MNTSSQATCLPIVSDMQGRVYAVASELPEPGFRWVVGKKKLMLDAVS
jgi:hypothetical protein